MKHNERDKRPKSITPSYSNVPDELKKVNQWVLYRYEWKIKEGTWAKVPFRTTGVRASSTDPDTWSSFANCLLAFEHPGMNFDGMGFVFTDDSPFVGVDLDNCIVEDGDDLKLTPAAAEIVENLKTYTELSPSQSGLHLIGRASDITAARGKLEENGVEIYSTGRYFTVTGQSWHDVQLPIVDIKEPLDALISKVKPKEKERSAQNTLSGRIELALKNPRTKALFDGDLNAFEGDHSRADLALCSQLAYYSNGDTAMLDAMFRQSKLFRDKWDEYRGSSTYGQMTIAKAMATQTSFYSGNGTTSASNGELRTITMSDIWDDVMIFRKDGGSRGVHPGWNNLERFYRPAEGLLSVVTGQPSSGKSSFVDALTYNIAVNHGWHIAYASFETLPIERHILNLCHIHLKKPTFIYTPGAATDEDMERARKELNDKFVFFKPDDHEMTMDAILGYVDNSVRERGTKGFVLDPFTELDIRRLGNTNQVEQIENVLRQLQQFTRSHSIHTWLVAHPAKGGETFKKEDKGERPTMRSIAGAAHFNNKADFGLVIQRWDDDTVGLYIDKVRNDSTGQRGHVEFVFDKDKREYVEIPDPTMKYINDGWGDKDES